MNDRQNSRILSSEKGNDGKKIIIVGAGLIDEFRFMVNPIVIGDGTPIFKGLGRLSLQLIKTRTFKSGNDIQIWQRIAILQPR